MSQSVDYRSMISEPIDNYPKDRNIEYFKMDCDKEFLDEMVSQLPTGYDFVMQGIVRENDILYLAFEAEWDIDNPIRFPEYKQIQNHGVNHFHGVARPIK